jgi:hypothetical protein
MSATTVAAAPFNVNLEVPETSTSIKVALAVTINLTAPERLIEKLPCF